MSDLVSKIFFFAVNTGLKGLKCTDDLQFLSYFNTKVFVS